MQSIMFTAKKYLSGIAGLLFLLSFLMTGCVKDEAIAPMADDELFKSIQAYDAQLDGDIKAGDEGDCDGDITDDEDDEDDTDRSTKH